jgi:hypothetical protein
MFLRPRQRLLIALVVACCLLFQQVALAAFACSPALAAQPAMPAGMEHCQQMQMPPAPAPSAVLCEKHCSPDQFLTSDASAPGVPAMAPPPAFSLVLFEPVSHAARQVEVPIARSDPPPRLRYCSLQI